MVAKCHVFVFIRLKKKSGHQDATNHYSLATSKERTQKHCHCSVFTCFISRSSLQTWLLKNGAILRKFVFANVFFLPRYLGRQELYAKRLREKYTGDVPMYSSLYISSESVIGVNLWPKDEPMYLPVLSAAFFEFVPVENCHEEQAKVSFRWTLCPDWLVARFFLHPLLRTSRASHVMIVQAYVKKKQKLLFISHSFQRRSLYILFQSHHEKDSIAVEAFFSPIFNSSWPQSIMKISDITLEGVVIQILGKGEAVSKKFFFGLV